MKVVILGGGISGLSAAWYLQRRGVEVAVLEKSDRVGGWIGTERRGGLFEKGPRTFPVGRGEHLLELIREMGLERELLFSGGGKRYVWCRGKLRRFSWGWIPGLVREWFIAKGEKEETVAEFARRRFGKRVAEEVIDLMVLGVYAGDMEKLSVQACFPFLVRWEREKGSVLRGVWGAKRGKKGLFTLRSGMGRLVEELEKRVRVERNCGVEEIREDGVVAGGRFWGADRVVSALPGQVLGRLTGLWGDFQTGSVWVVRLGFRREVLRRRGFGYLVPSKEGEPLMGMVWDSSIFPEQGEGRMTAMVREGVEEPVEVALEALKRHLGIEEMPVVAEAELAKEAIPQFGVGYGERLERFLRDIRRKFPGIEVIGNYLEGPSVEACIRMAKNISL